MSGKPVLTTAERWRRYQRDLKAYRRRSLFRRSHPRFHRDLSILPNLFLLRDRARMAPLLMPAEQIREELKGCAIWTLDTAARLVTGHGFLVAHDLMGYLDRETLEKLIEKGRVGIPEQAGLRACEEIADFGLNGGGRWQQRASASFELRVGWRGGLGIRGFLRRLEWPR